MTNGITWDKRYPYIHDYSLCLCESCQREKHSEAMAIARYSETWDTWPQSAQERGEERK